MEGMTDRETSDYLRDHGHRVAAAQAYKYLGRLIETDDSYPLPEGSEAVIASAAAALQEITATRTANAEAYAARRVAEIHEAVAETHARIYSGSAA